MTPSSPFRGSRVPRRVHTTMALRAFLGLCVSCILGALAQAAEWRALNLVTEDGRPSPPITTKEIGAATALATDPALPYPMRTQAVAKLAGSTRRSVVRALGDLLLAEASTREGRRLRVACAAALGWSAFRRSREAGRALYETMYSPQTHIHAGEATARALLNTVGPLEALSRIHRRLVRTKKGDDDGDRLDLAFSWTSRELRPCHSLRSRDELWRKLADRLASELRRISSESLVMILSRGPCREVLRETLGHSPRSTLGDFLLERFERGGKAEREALAVLFSPSLAGDDDWGRKYKRFLFRLDSRRVRMLWSGSRGLSDKAARHVTRLVEAVCYGHKEVWEGEAAVSEALMETLDDLGWMADKDNLERADAQAAAQFLQGPGSLLYFCLWEHIGLHPVRFDDPTSHPYLRLVENTKRPVWERWSAVDYLRHSRRLGGIGESADFARAVEGVFTACRGKRTGTQAVHWTTREDKMRQFFLAGLAALSTETTPAGQRRETAERFLASSDPLTRASLLRHLSKDAYVRLANGEPVWLAEQGLAALEMMASEEDRWPENYTQRVLNVTSGLVDMLTPEDVLRVERPKIEDLQSVVTRWRAWLERFRKLPVFNRTR